VTRLLGLGLYPNHNRPGKRRHFSFNTTATYTKVKPFSS
jgi:hypothetical protein